MIVLGMLVLLAFDIYLTKAADEEIANRRRLLKEYYLQVQNLEQQHIEDVTALKTVAAERDKYKTALEAIASTKHDMNKLVCIAIEALKGKSNESE